MVVLMRTYLAAKAASINVIPKHDVLVIVGGTPHIKHLEEIIVPAYAAVIVTRKAFAMNFLEGSLQDVRRFATLHT